MHSLGIVFTMCSEYSEGEEVNAIWIKLSLSNCVEMILSLLQDHMTETRSVLRQDTALEETTQV
jgi:hypothetical protein